MCGMLEGLPLYLPLRLQPRGWATNPDPVGLELLELALKLRRATRGVIRRRLILPPKEHRRQQELETLGAGKPSTAAPPEQPSPAPRPDSHTQGWESRHPAPETSGDRPTRAWSRRVGSGLGASWMGVGGEAWPKLSPVGGLGPAAARKTDFRRLF